MLITQFLPVADAPSWPADNSQPHRVRPSAVQLALPAFSRNAWPSSVHNYIIFQEVWHSDLQDWSSPRAVINVTAATKRATADGLHAGTLYRFTMKASNESHTSRPSSGLIIHTLDESEFVFLCCSSRHS